MTLKEKLKLAQECKYTLSFIAKKVQLSPNTLYALMYRDNYHLSEKNFKKIDNFLDSLELNSNNKYCVYIHKNKINNKVYVGLTSINPIHRWKNGEGYKNQPKFYNAIKKYGWDNFQHIIIKDHLSVQNASDLEKQLIQQYNSLNNQKGYNNRTGGVQSYTLTPEQRWARGKAFRGKNFSEQHKKKISEALKNRTFSEETRIKMSEAKKKAGTFKGKNNPKATQVICLENQIIYDTITEAANSTNTSRDGISKCCKGLQKTANKKHWAYYNK